MRNFHFYVIHLVKLTSPCDIVDSCIFIVDYNYRQDGSNGSKAIYSTRNNRMCLTTRFHGEIQSTCQSILLLLYNNISSRQQMALLAVPFIKHVRCLGLYVRSESYSGQYIFPPEICLHLEILMANISQIFV